MSFFSKLYERMSSMQLGVVSSGEYEGCRFSMMLPKENEPTQIVFFKKGKIDKVACFVIGKDIIDVEYTETIKFPKTGFDGFRCKITFEKGDTCDIDLFPEKSPFIYEYFKVIMNKETKKFFEKEIDK